MRVRVSDVVYVQPGDEIVIRASLAPDARLGRLHVFAKEGENEKFSPYVPDLAVKMVIAADKPSILTPMSMRLDKQNPLRVGKFIADIDGLLCVMEELDTVKDPRSRVQIRRRINPRLPWQRRLWRQASELFA